VLKLESQRKEAQFRAMMQGQMVLCNGFHLQSEGEAEDEIVEQVVLGVQRGCSGSGSGGCTVPPAVMRPSSSGRSALPLQLQLQPFARAGAHPQP
jgi:hypothetical protein